MTTFDAEQVVLGSIIDNPALADEVFARLDPTVFTGPHQAIAEALLGMHTLGVPISAETLLHRLNRAGLLVRSGGGPMIHTLVSSSRVREEALVLVEVIATEAARRSVRAIGTRLVQMSENPTIEPEEAIQHAAASFDELSLVSDAPETVGWPEGDTDPEPEWIIPDLLAKDERVMITGGEGLGKTMLIRQMVASVAIGYHPFDGQSFDARPALHVDLENPKWVSDSGYRLIRRGLTAAGIKIPDDTLHRLELKRFDVTNAREVTQLLRLIRGLEPSLIAIGPVKNMGGEDPNEERSTVRIQDVLNQIRSESSAALLLEGHAGHGSRGEEGDWRPRGSSAWLGWPEFGFGMKPIKDRGYRAAELVEWRGARPQGRFWPEVLAAGTPLPWTQAPG